jgi:hypothetical protein
LERCLERWVRGHQKIGEVTVDACPLPLGHTTCLP